MLDHDEFVGGPAVRIAIFLTLFNVHINRMPCRCGRLNCDTRPANFCMPIIRKPPRKTKACGSAWSKTNRPTAAWFAGKFPAWWHGELSAICGRERCWTAARKFGMIKFGSRTELIVPAAGFPTAGDASASGSKPVATWWDDIQSSRTIFKIFDHEKNTHRRRTTNAVHVGESGLRILCHCRGFACWCAQLEPSTPAAEVVANNPAVQNHPLSEFYTNDPTPDIMLSGWLIFLAMIFDALDGHVARLVKMSSDFVAQLDSLCDLVTFGVAPAFLVVKMCPDFTFFHREAMWIIAAAFAACTAMRLARFTVETDEDDDHLNFIGLPSPAAAGSIAGFAILFYTLRVQGGHSAICRRGRLVPAPGACRFSP